MKTSDWDDPSIRAIGRRYAAEAYDLASELNNYGADAAALLKSQQDPTRPRDVSIPAMLADVAPLRRCRENVSDEARSPHQETWADCLTRTFAPTWTRS